MRTSTLRTAIFILLSLTSISPASAAGAPNTTDKHYRPLRKIVSFAEFNNLVRDSAKRIPDLQDLWNWRLESGYGEIYFGGGTVRGLLHWLFIQLQDHSIAEINRMPMPRVEQLQLQGGSDKDLFVADRLAASLPNILPQYAESAGWEIIDEKFYKGAVETGGPTLEKVRVNPGGVDDPLGGLKDYYNGKLVFSWTPQKKLIQLHESTAEPISRTAEALRFIRFTYNLPELTPDKESVRLIRTISSIEKDIADDQRVLQALLKLQTATGENLRETANALKQYNLLNVSRTKPCPAFLKPR